MSNTPKFGDMNCVLYSKKVYKINAFSCVLLDVVAARTAHDTEATYAVSTMKLLRRVEPSGLIHRVRSRKL